MRKTIAALLLFSLLIVGCSNNSLKSNDPDSVPTQNQTNNEQETQHQGNNIFESKEDIQNGIKSNVAIKTYYEEPASLKDKNTVILNGLLKGEFVEVVVEGEIKDFKHVELKWDDRQSELIETRVINKFETLTNKTIVIQTYLPDGIPSEKIEWKTISGKVNEFIIAESNLKIAQKEVTNDNTPKLPIMKGKDLEGFIPEGWNIKSSAEGDLNMDSLPDIIAVIEKDDDEDSSFPRILFVLVQDKDKSYTLTVKTATAIMRANEGGVFGDPFETISVDRGSILLSFYGGSNWRWYKQYRFRFQDDGWYLIGATLGSYFTGTTTKDDADEEDYNLLTGDYIIKKADEKGIVNTTKGNREKRKLINLNEFIVNSEENQF
ncbi:hypothetical protein [Desulfosporosinus sp. BICA1-9]|uniref:hypothetical protein n=1 Tax=Desulfosporosinus sp. BICA1-9 TaxID=1531958 RepID=UPI00054BC110|nr:hypothetical protein [Desulfosporosinus sp. BICA1-9]KJS48895.1 MAG: hypothetical protein VR66_11530 [Peptococcaceae bacterium BRH_c23]KJS87475.1 MAG: hypothetical protein JL57_13965 [Desulfosporosinus sp. BICA1-9]HBW36642.1 hypothetical protein [Desulfosporosinus sp.]